MNESVIKVQNLSKQYRIGEREPYKTIRETLVGAARAPFQKLSSFRSSKSTKTNPKSETIWALKDVSFEIERGEVVGIIGRNGAGKSTLLKILSRITEPTNGRVELRGRVGSLLEVGTGFHPELTGHENIYLYGAILGMDRYEITRKFDEIVAFSELEKFIETPVKRYSSGMYMRLAFAVAAYMEPEILLVDEVLAVGDMVFQKKCLGKMGLVANEGRTVLFVSHNLAAIKSLCEKCFLLEDGQIVKSGKTPSVVDQYQRNLDVARNMDLADRKDRRGKGAVQFTKLYCVGHPISSDESNICSGQDVYIVMHLKSMDGKQLKNIDIDVRISDLQSNYLLTCSTRYKGSYIKTIPSYNEVVCHIPKVPLAPGEYRIDLWACMRGVEEDYIENAGRLVVIEGDFFGTGKLPAPGKHGPFLVDHAWAVRRADCAS